MAQPFLSKSRYLTGLQCLKYLWLLVNDPQRVPQPDAMTQHVFDQGHLVEQLARTLFPDGTEVPFQNFQGNIRQTRSLLKERRTLFQAGIMSGSIYSRLDVLKPSGDAAWDIFEIKSSTKVKDENLADISFQKYCCEQQGLTIDRCFIVHINNRYIRHGQIDPVELFVTEDVTGAAGASAVDIAARVRNMLDTLGAVTCPETRIGPHCKAPYECLVSLCQDSLPDNTILELYRGGGKAFDLFYGGVRYLREIPDDVRLTESQNVQKWCDANSCAYVDTDSIKAFLTTLRYPVHYLDFETFNTAVPLFDGTRPYQNIPFQFSVHVLDRPGSMPLPFSFLAGGPEDPRPPLLDRLHQALGKEGSIVVYNRSFEDNVLQDLGGAFPEYHGWAEGIRSRLVDLLLPFRKFHYYHPQQKGSASIKNVLPALTGHSYQDLDIGKGDEASLAYLNMTYGETPEAEKAKVRADLEKYCGLDTEGMILIVRRLAELGGVVENSAQSAGRKRRSRAS